jgi:hypothetical protein
MYPGAPATAEGIDNNCNGSIDPEEELPPCLADYNNDGIRNTPDMLVLLAAFGCLSDCPADLNGDDIVGTPDILIFLTVFGVLCP